MPMSKEQIAETARACADKAHAIVGSLDPASRQQKAVLDLIEGAVMPLADCVAHLTGVEVYPMAGDEEPSNLLTESRADGLIKGANGGCCPKFVQC